MFIANAEILPAIKSALFRNRVWQASNLAMWALSPPQSRCLMVHITNYDYVSVAIKKITLSTGDVRENLVLEHKNQTPLNIIPSGDHHQWVVDAMPLFLDIACALHEDQQKQQKDENKKTRRRAYWQQKITQPLKDRAQQLSQKMALKIAQDLKPQTAKFIQQLKEKRPITQWRNTLQKLSQKTQPLRKEIATQSIALEDVIEEHLSPAFIDFISKAKIKAQMVFRWLSYFLKKLPAFSLHLSYHIIKAGMRGFWEGLKAPFAKFSPVRRKIFHAIIELDNGQILKTKQKIGVTYYFIAQQIMPLMFSPEELRQPEPLSNQLMDMFLDMLQIRNQSI